MVKRLYLPNTGVAPVSPAFSATWLFTTGADRILAVQTRINSAMATKTVTDATATANRDALARQYVSEPLTAQTITGTIKGRVRVAESLNASNLRSQCIVRVVSADGATVRGTLYAGDLTTGTANPTSEWALTTLTNRQMPRGTTQTVTSVAAQLGDRIVIEIGYRKHAAASTTGTLVFGDNAAADLAEDETTTTANNPWVEFSQTLTFQTVHALVGSTGGTGGQTGTLRLTTRPAGSTGGAGAQTGSLSVASGSLALLAWAEFEVPDAGVIEGTTGGMGGQTGAIRVAWTLDGATGGTGNQSANVTIPPIALLAWAELEVPDAPTQQHALDGATDGMGAQTGTLRLLRPLDATSAGIGDQTGDIDVVWRLAGTSSGIGSQAAAEPTVVYALEGTSDGAGDMLGALFQSGVLPLAGATDGIGDQTGDIDIAWRLGGTTGGVGGSAGAVRVVRSLAGSTGGVGNASGQLAAEGLVSLRGTTDGTGAQTGDIDVAWRLGGTTGGIGATTGRLRVLWSLDGTTGGIGGARGALAVAGPGVYDDLTGTLAVDRALNGTLAVERELTGTLSLEVT